MKTILYRFANGLIVGMVTFLLFRLYTEPTAWLMDKIVYTPLVVVMGLFALSVTGFGRPFLALWPWLQKDGIYPAAVLIIYSFLRALS